MSTLKVLIVEDSELVSDILTDVLESDKQVIVVGVARNGVEALEMVPRLNPDLITMDVWMPIMDGFQTVERIMADFPTPILVITSSSLKDDVQLSLRMLSAGALDIMEKPSFQDESRWEHNRNELLNKVHLLSGIRVVTHLRGKKSASTYTPLASDKPTLSTTPPFIIRDEDKVTKPLQPTTLRVPIKKPATTSNSPADLGYGYPTFPARPFYQLVAIASSTGGPSALLKILQILPPNFPAAILIVQHISQGFTFGLVEWLQRETRLKVNVASLGDKIAPGRVFIAPDRYNLTIKAHSPFELNLNQDGEEFIRPNADVLLNSVALAFGERAVGIVLTGMGSDGAKGLKEMSMRGAYTIAQDEATSLIYGMPKAAVDNLAVRQVLPLTQIAPTMVKLLQQPV